MANRRMKDYCDLWVLLRERELVQRLRAAFQKLNIFWRTLRH